MGNQLKFQMKYSIVFASSLVAMISASALPANTHCANFDYSICTCVVPPRCRNLCPPGTRRHPQVGCTCLTDDEYDGLHGPGLDWECLPRIITCPNDFEFNYYYNRCERVAHF